MPNVYFIDNIQIKIVKHELLMQSLRTTVQEDEIH